MPQELPFIPSVPFQQVSTQLEGISYVIDLRWNTRDAAWYMDLLEEDETPIVNGKKIVLGVNIGGRSAAASLPGGVIIASDLSGAGQEAGIDDLGDRVRVYFFTDAELAG